MAKYPALTTTQVGINAISEANASKKPLIFTRVILGSGDVPKSIFKATELTRQVMSLEISKYVNNGNGQFTVSAALDNKTLEEGFYAKEVGLLVKVGDEGSEVLFSYTNGGNYVDYIPDKSTPMDAYVFNLTTVVGNAGNVTAVMNNTGYASIKDFNEIAAKVRNGISEISQDSNRIKIIGGSGNVNYIDLITATDEESKNMMAPSLMLVKSLLSSQMHITDTTLKDIKGLLGTGGIVAQRLDKNGFVQFANGFMIQWGSEYENVRVGDEYKYNINFPIAFSVMCIGIWGALRKNTAGGGNFAACFNNETRTGAILAFDDSDSSGMSNGYRYIAIGY